MYYDYFLIDNLESLMYIYFRVYREDGSIVWRKIMYAYTNGCDFEKIG